MPANHVDKLSEERNEDDLYSVGLQSFNLHKSLSIEHQRLRLPINRFKDHVLYLLEKRQVLVVVGETGSGKSTQIPQFLLEGGFSKDGKMIAITQPRRIAAISLAGRVAEEAGSFLGHAVGYSIRFEEFYDREKTKIKFMTEGILIREMMNDPLLANYSVIMVDEIHERSVNTDILLSLLKKIIKKRPEMRLIIASATLETDVIYNYFNRINQTQTVDRTSVLCIDGRAFPVEIFYLDQPCANYLQESVDTVIKIHENFPNGDVLVFLTGFEEVEECVEKLFNYAMGLKDKYDRYKRLYVLPLHASLPTKEQAKVFETFPKNVRKVIVATNIAEASLTIDGISFVVDCGFVKMRTFNHKTGTDSLVVVPISKASAAQRAGRAGRTRRGYAFRLYPESEFQKLPDFTSPEMQRVSLASVILQLKALGVNNIVKFDLLTPPPEANIVCALDILFALKAIDETGALTDPLGMHMAEFPLDPAFSKMLLVSGQFGCSEEMLTIASMLQVANIFAQPGGGQRAIQARRAKHNLSVAEGDVITYLNIYNQFLHAAQVKSWSDRNYLHYKGLVRAVEIRNRLKSLLRRFSIPLVSTTNLDDIRKCLVAGFFTNAATLAPDGASYRTIRGDHELYIHPTSVLHSLKRLPSCVLFTEVLHTTKDFMKDVTAIESRWLYEIAPHYYQFGTDREIRERNSKN